MDQFLPLKKQQYTTPVSFGNRATHCNLFISITNSKHHQPGEPPLDQIQPVFTRSDTDIILGHKLTSTYLSAILLHKLACDGSISTLERRIDELTPEILNHTKYWEEIKLEHGRKVTLTKVRQPPPHYPPALTHLVQVSPLLLACWFVKTEFALALLRAGALPDLVVRRSKDGKLYTPLFYSARPPSGAELC